MKIERIKFPLIIFLFSRLAIFLLAAVFIGIWPTKVIPSFFQAFSQWDGRWYLEIVEKGYWYQGPNVQSPVIFFPLFPLLGKFLTWFGFSSPLSLFLVANFSCLGFFIFFWLWAKEEFGRKTADRALFYYAISPLSFLFSSLYAESLFLLCCCASFYFLKKNDFLKASIMAGLAAVTRPFGVILILPILFCLWEKKRKIRPLINFGLVAVSGIVLFLAYLYFKVGKLAPFLGVQMKAWPHLWTTPWASIKLFLESILIIPSWSQLFSIAVFDLIIVSLFTILLFYSLKKISFTYQLFMWPVYLLSMTQPWDPGFFTPNASVARHLFQIFPLMAFLAGIGKRNEWLHYLIIFFFASLFGVFGLAFFHGAWIE